MLYFKDNTNRVYAYDDNADPKYIKPGLVPITQADADALLAPTAEQVAARQAAEAEAAKFAADVSQAKAYQKLTTLANMSPAEISTWIDANVTNLAQAQDAIKTLAIGLSVLVRKL